MAVDANILIYERIREELRNGGVAAPRPSRRGFDRAFSAIADSNVTALIAGPGVCGCFGAGAVRGFRGGAGHRHRDLDVHVADGQSRPWSRSFYGGKRKVERLSI